jgi:hypothetical protein
MTNAELTPPTQELPIESPNGEAPESAEPYARFLELAAAVRRHANSTSPLSVPRRPGDVALYRRLVELEESPLLPGDEPA